MRVDFYLIPRTWIDPLPDSTPDRSRRWLERDWWIGAHVPDALRALRESASRVGDRFGDSELCWGDEDGNHLLVRFVDHQVASVRVGVDGCRLDRAFLRGVLELASRMQAAMMTAEGQVVSAEVGDVLAAVHRGVSAAEERGRPR